MDSNLDNLFKKALQEQVCEPPQEMWGRIEGRLAGRQRRVIGRRWLQGAAAIALLAAVAGLWQFSRSEEPLPVASRLPETVQEEQAHKVAQPTISVEEVEVTGKPQAVEASAPVQRAGGAEFTERVSPLLAQRGEETLLMADGKTPDIKWLKQDFIPLTSGDALKNQETYLTMLRGNAEEEKEKEREKAKITLSGHFVPAYSAGSYVSSTRSARGMVHTKDQLDGLMNVGGGLQLAIAPGKRLSFETGIFYSRMGQQSTEGGRRMRSSAFSAGKKMPKTDTPWGNIKLNHRALEDNGKHSFVLSGASTSDQTLEQVFGSIEIPVHVRYRLNDNKVAFSLAGGLSGGFLVNNKVFSESNGRREWLGETDEIRTFNLSTDVSVGVEYPISRYVKFMLEPGFRYFLQSLSRNEYIDFKPYTFTLSTGIGITF